MARTKLEAAEALRAAVWLVKDANPSISVRELAKAVGISAGSVQNFLKRRPDTSKVDAITSALALKADPAHKHRGPMELHATLIAEGMAAGVSEKTLERRIRAAGLARKGAHRHSKRAPYQTEARPSAYLDMIQMDTKKIRLGTTQIELLVVRDVFTGCTVVLHHTGTQEGMLHKMALIFSIFGGVPRVLQTDNGTTDFSMPKRGKLRPWQAFAFARGVERIQFIPEAEPHRNGSVESFNNWLQTEFDNHGQAHNVNTVEAFDHWLQFRMFYYNYQKPLSSTRAIPASLSGDRFNINAEYTSGDLAFDAPTSGTVSFLRYVSRSLDRETGEFMSVAPVKNPGTIFVVPPEFEGGYLRFDCSLDGSGTLIAPREVDTLSAIASGHRKVNGRYVSRLNPGIVVGSFVSPFADPSCPVVVVQVDQEMADLFSPVLTDPTAIARVWRKVLKQAIPEILPGGMRLVLGSDDTWEVLDRRGNLIWSEQSSPAVIEHAREHLES